MKKHTFDFVPAVLAGFCTAALMIGPFEAHAASTTPASSTFEIVRPGDHDMACPALATEINQLGQPQAAVAEARPKKRGGLGFLKVLGSAAPLVGGMGGGMGGALVSTVAGTASQLASSNQMEDQMGDARQMARDAMAGGTPTQQRKERLMAIFEEKHC